MASAEAGVAGAAGGSGSVPAADWDADGISADGTWLELAVTTDLEAVEAVSEILSRHAGAAAGGGAAGGAGAAGGVGAATSVEPGFRLVEEGLGAEIDTARPAIVRAYLPGGDRAAARAAVEGIRRDLGHLQAFGLREIGELVVGVVHESDWAEAWKEHFPVLHLGRRLVVRPTWREVEPSPDDVVLSLDPGMAFGTGLHPTTRLCLEGIERWADAGLVGPTVRALDVGCGSGILAIALALFGAGEVAGLDTDPIAVEATAANAATNGMTGRIHARQGSLPSGERGAIRDGTLAGGALAGGTHAGGALAGGAFDLVAANLIASLLVALAAELRAELRAGGRLLASGIFADRESDVRAAFAGAGLRVTGRWSEGDWVALEAVRDAEDVVR